MKARRAKQRRASRPDLLKRLRKAERRLRQVEERYEIAMGAINESVYDWDIARDRFSYSESMQRVIGLPAELLRTIGDWQKRVHPDDFPHFRAATVAHLKGTTERLECDYRYRALDGTWRWARTHGAAIRDKNGRAVRIIGSTGDITELKQRERELAEQKAILETTFENIDQGITMVDRNLRTIALNRKFLELLEFPPERFGRGFHMEDAFRFNAERGEYGPGDVEAQVRQRVELSRRFEPHAFERTRPDGRVIAVRGKPLPGGGFVSTYSDVTEQRRAEEGLKTSEQRYALATSAALEGIYEWNLETGMLFLSDRAKAFFAFPAADLTPVAWNARIHPDDFAGYRAAIVDHFKGHTSHVEHEYRIADARGAYKWVLERGIGVRNAQGRVTKVVGALSDITERKLAEIELRRARDQAEEALTEQTAVRGVLETLSRSAFDLGAVLRTLIESATRLCRAEKGFIFLLESDAYRLAVDFGASAEFREFIERNPIRPGRGSLVGRTALEGRTVHIEDAATDPEYQWTQSQKLGGFRTMLGVPIVRDGTVVGVIAMWKERVEPFTPAQMALVTSFSNQALIALENARLFNETREALEQQTATSEILGVISGSPTDVQPVFEAIVRSGVRLFEGAAVAVARPENGQVRLMAIAERDPERAQKWKERFPFPLTPEYMHSAAILDCKTVDMPDVLVEDGQYAAGKRNFAPSGYRAMTVVPMVRDGAAIGTISVIREAPGPLNDKQIALLKTFADQAVIAIENVRLFNETTEALEQQKASAEILSVISGSVADTQPVFEAILESCERLFEGRNVGINLVGEDGKVHIGAYHGPNQAQLERHFPVPLSMESGSGGAILQRTVVHYPDIEGGHDVPDYARRGSMITGSKSVIFAPMVWEGRGIGAVFVGRNFAGPFSDKEIALLKTFADQAVIAIQNARLFREIHEKSQQLEIANRHKSEFLANMSHELRTPLNAVIGFTRIVMRRSQEQLEPKQYENLEKILASGQHLLALINAILDLAKVEAGHVQVNASEIPLAPVLEQCVRTVEPLVKTEAVTLLKEFSGELPQLYLDEEKLRQIVINLLSNAVKFTASGSIRVQAHAANGCVAIAVADTGIGIAADKLGLIFEEFEQVDARSTRVYGGTGLGLAIARRLARLMGGDIAVQSTPGSGSTFTLTLPVRYQAQG